MTKPLHTGWFRCRIKGGPKSNYRFVYFRVTVAGRKIELKREARYLAGLYLHRQVFEFGAVHAPPEPMSTVKTINDTTFYYLGAMAEVPTI